MAKAYLVISRLKRRDGERNIFEFEDVVFPSAVEAANHTTARADQTSAAGWDYEGFVLEVDEGAKKAKARDLFAPIGEG